MEKGIHIGRTRREGKDGAKRSFTESAIFTLGLAFIIVYIVGMISSGSRGVIDYESREVVAVFASEEEPKESGNVWDLLDECFEKAFSKN